MNIKIYLDDSRVTPPGYVRTYTAQQTIEVLKSTPVDTVSLDHDLGDAADVGNGYDVVQWLEMQAFNGNWTCVPKSIVVHSANPVGRQKMLAGIQSIQKMRNMAE